MLQKKRLTGAHELFRLVYTMVKNYFRYIFIFNPAADKGRAFRKSQWLHELVSGRKDSLVITTTYAGHAGDIARCEAKENICLIACGGDGTIHDIVNAVAGAGITIGVLPIGSANDFIKTLYPDNIESFDITHFYNASCRNVDLGSVYYGKSEHRYFVNSLGIGLTGSIAKSVQETMWLKGEPGYIYALLRVLFDYVPLVMTIKITLENSIMELHEPVFAFSVLNGKIEGGKFRIAPHAELSDGLLDVCILKAVPKHEFFRYVLKYLRGIHITDPQVIYCKATAVEVILENPHVMHMDGEVYDNVCGRITISVVSNGLSVI